MRKRGVVIGVAVAGLFVHGSLVVAQSRKTGGVTGRVSDSTGARLANVAITIGGGAESGPRAASDDSGSFRLRGIGAGRVRVIARRLGYEPETLLVVVSPGVDAKADFVLRAVPVQLAGQDVDADPSRGKMGPFNKRKARGVGAFVTREEIERRQPSSISELLRYLPGVGVTQRMAGEPQPVRMIRSASSSMQSTCVVQIYVDGHPYPNGNVDDFQPMSIEGVEVYRSASEIPADFRTQDATCGVIALWTRDPDAARRKP